MIKEENIKSLVPKLFSKEHFENFSAIHSWEPGWLVDSRKESWEQFMLIEENDLKNEKWRFSPKSRFGFSNHENIADSNLSPKFNLNIDAPDVICDSVDNILLEDPDLISLLTGTSGPNLGARQAYELTNTFFNNGFFIKVPNGFNENLRIEVHHNLPKSEEVSFHRNLVTLEDFAELTIVETFSGDQPDSSGLLSNLTHFNIGKGAKLNRILIQNYPSKSSFYNLENFDLHADSSVVNVECYTGASQSRIETKGNLLEPGSSFENFSFVSAKSEQLFDQRTEQHHIGLGLIIFLRRFYAAISCLIQS